MPAQGFHNLQALSHRGAEVPGTFNQVALINVVGAHADAHQVLHQLSHQVRIVIDASQQHRLIP